MKWSEVIDRVAAETGVSKAQTRRTLDAFRRVVAEALVNRRRVPLPGVGVLDVRVTRDRTIRSIQTGRKLWVGGRAKATFRASGVLNSALTAGKDFWRRAEHQAAWRLAQTLIADLELYNKGKRPELTASQSLGRVREVCLECYGEDWEQAAETYEAKVEASVRSEHDHLGASARSRWSAAR
jgi:DNA-binding protein HU-beta